MSSVLGLKASPSTPTVFPARDPGRPSVPRAALTREAMAFLRASLTATVVSISRRGAPADWAVRTRARVSFGKHEPP